MKPAIQAATALCIGVLSATSGGQIAQARPIAPAERRFEPLTGNVPACGDASLLRSIVQRFQSSEHQYWSSGLALLSFDRVQDNGYRTDGYDYVPRRYCEARATFNDDKYRQVVYWIGERLGFAGYGFGVEWCIRGLDRNYAFGLACQAAGP